MMKEEKSIADKKEIIRYVEYDAQTFMNFIEHKEQESVALTEILKSILEKCFILMFSLNGGAAITTLAFLGNVISKDFHLWKITIPWIRYSLVNFSVGSLFVVVAAMISYISQCFFCESLGAEINNDKQALKLKNNFPDGRIVDENYVKKIKKINDLNTKGRRWRQVAIFCAINSLTFFLLGIYCFYCAFGYL